MKSFGTNMPTTKNASADEGRRKSKNKSIDDYFDLSVSVDHFPSLRQN